MEVHFNPELEAKNSGADHLDHDVWFRQKVAEGLEQLDKSQFLSHEEVGARLKKMSERSAQIDR